MIPRFAKRKDTTEPEIVEALRKAGWMVYIIGWPCDLLLFKSGFGFRTLECKTPTGKKNPKARVRKDQAEQNAFIEITGTPRVISAEDALKAVGDIHAIA